MKAQILKVVAWLWRSLTRISLPEIALLNSKISTNIPQPLDRNQQSLTFVDSPFLPLRGIESRAEMGCVSE